MTDFRSRVKEDLIKNKVPVIKYSPEEHICDLELLLEMGENRIAELEKNLLLAEDLLSDNSYQYYLESTGKSLALKEQDNE